ncbi:MAG: hypothetical protein ACI85K_002742 [Hyphomicrobiaceae bacterium]|jgi:hypothetical protein
MLDPDMIASRAGILTIAAIGLLAAATTAQRDLANWNGNAWQRLAQMPISAPVAGGHLVVTRDVAAAKNCQADVYVVAKSAVDEQTQQFLYRHFLLESDVVLASRHAKRYRTDKRGMVRVEMPEDGLCIAITDGKYGRRETQPKATYIGVHPCGTVRAEVVDQHGRPAPNVIVWIGQVNTELQFACGCSDSSGRIEARVPKHASGPGLIVQAAIASHNRGTQSIPASYFDGEPKLLQVKLPATGSVALTIHDPAGIKPTGAHNVVLKWPSAQHSGGHRSLRPTSWIDDKAVFQYVALGLQIEAKLWGTSPKQDKATSKGPTKAGERIELAVTLGANQLVLKGRLLTADGRVPATTKFWVRISDERQVRRSQGALNEQGRFALPIDTLIFNGKTTRVEFFAGQRSANEASAAAMTEVSSDRPKAVEIGVLNVGDLTLQPQQVMLRGQVVSSDGEPVANANVSAPLTWNPGAARGHRVQTDQHGWFTMHELTPKSGSVPLHIRTGAWQLQTQTATGTVGKLDHRIEIARHVSLVASVRDQQYSSMLVYEAFPTTGKRTGFPGRPNGTKIEFLDMAAGTYDVVIRLGRHQLARIERVAVTAIGQPSNHDPRLRDITWTNELQTAGLRVVSEKGKPLRANGYVATGAQTNSSWLVADVDGLMTLPFGKGHTFFVRHAGRRSAVVTPAKTRTEVRLPPCALLKLSLPKGLSLPKEIQVHFSSELSEFGVKDLTLPWRPDGPNYARPEAMRQTTLRLTLKDLRGQPIELHRQTVQLPMSDEAINVVINITEEDASFATEAAANMAKVRGG